MNGTSILPQLLMSGLVIGCVYALIGLGFVVIFKATKILNFAQGELLMLGAYMCFVFNVTLKLPYVVAFLLTLVFAFVLGIVLEFALFRHMVGQPVFSMIMITVGLSSVFRSIAVFIWGDMDMVPLPSPFPKDSITVLGASITYPQLVTLCGTVGMLALFALFYRISKVGTAIRAACDDQDAASLTGVNLNRVFQIAWIMAAVVATVGGIFLGHINYLDTSMGFIAIHVFPAVILGGMESILGALLGGLIIGMAENLVGGLISSNLQGVTAYIVLIIILLIKPHGLFGEDEIERI
ncbi:MAG: branched-chain amino acid ABC transporter permease [Deltaproteobacteria bacterium]|nr:branched-chain amino acid ABC transporter permease [Deltaproteobacteria bacterium]